MATRNETGSGSQNEMGTDISSASEQRMNQTYFEMFNGNVPAVTGGSDSSQQQPDETDTDFFAAIYPEGRSLKPSLVKILLCACELGIPSEYIEPVTCECFHQLFPDVLQTEFSDLIGQPVIANLLTQLDQNSQLQSPQPSFEFEP